MVHIQPRKHVHGEDFVAPTRRRELERTDRGYNIYIYIPERSRSGGNRLCVRAVKYLKLGFGHF